MGKVHVKDLKRYHERIVLDFQTILLFRLLAASPVTEMDPWERRPTPPGWAKLHKFLHLLRKIEREHPGFWNTLDVASLEDREYRTDYAPRTDLISVQPHAISSRDATTQASSVVDAPTKPRPNKTDASTQVSISNWTHDASTQTESRMYYNQDTRTGCHVIFNDTAAHEIPTLVPIAPSANTPSSWVENVEPTPITSLSSPNKSAPSPATTTLAPSIRGCWNCGVEGHERVVCPVPTRRLVCYRCGTPGVRVSECPKCAPTWHPAQVLPSKRRRAACASFHPYEEPEVDPCTFRPIGRSRGRL